MKELDRDEVKKKVKQTIKEKIVDILKDKVLPPMAAAFTLFLGYLGVTVQEILPFLIIGIIVLMIGLYVSWIKNDDDAKKEMKKLNIKFALFLAFGLILIPIYRILRDIFYDSCEIFYHIDTVILFIEDLCFRVKVFIDGAKQSVGDFFVGLFS